MSLSLVTHKERISTAKTQKGKLKGVDRGKGDKAWTVRKLLSRVGCHSSQDKPQSLGRAVDGWFWVMEKSPLYFMYLE